MSRNDTKQSRNRTNDPAMLRNDATLPQGGIKQLDI